MLSQLPLWSVFVIAGVVALLGYSQGRRNGRRALRWQYEQGYNAGQVDRNDAILARMRNGWRLVMNPSTDQPVWRGFYEGLAWPQNVGDGPDTDTITAVMPSSQPSDSSYRRQLAAIAGEAVPEPELLTGRPFTPHAGRPPWHELEPRGRHAAPVAAGGGWTSGPCPPEPEPGPEPGPELERLNERFWLAVVTLTAGLAIGDRYSARVDDVSFAGAPVALAELEGPGGLAELEHEIDDYLADKSHGDVWRLEVDAARRRWCYANGIDWQPIDWEG